SLDSIKQVIEQSTDRSSYESSNLGLRFQYPEGWAIEEVDDSIYLAANPEQFPWSSEFYTSSRKPYYHLYKVSPYDSWLDRLFGREQSIEQIAEEIAYT